MEGLAENRTSDLFLQDSGNTVKGKARRKGEVLGGGHCPPDAIWPLKQQGKRPLNFLYHCYLHLLNVCIASPFSLTICQLS